jgi:hypothetical protein
MDDSRPPSEFIEVCALLVREYPARLHWMEDQLASCSAPLMKSQAEATAAALESAISAWMELTSEFNRFGRSCTAAMGELERCYALPPPADELLSDPALAGAAKMAVEIRTVAVASWKDAFEAISAFYALVALLVAQQGTVLVEVVALKSVPELPVLARRVADASFRLGSSTILGPFLDVVTELLGLFAVEGDNLEEAGAWHHSHEARAGRYWFAAVGCIRLREEIALAARLLRPE